MLLMKPGGCHRPVNNLVHDLVAEPIQRQYFFREAGTGNQARHSPDDAGRFILRKNVSAALPYDLTSAQAVPSHPGEHNRDNRRTVNFGHRAKQHIHGWPAKIFRWSFMQIQDDVHTVSFHYHVMIAGCDPCNARSEPSSSNRLFYLYERFYRQTIGKKPGKDWRHVLYDHDGHGEVGRKKRHEFGERAGAASGHTNSHDTHRSMGSGTPDEGLRNSLSVVAREQVGREALHEFPGVQHRTRP
jgi:hypothetical protein